MALTSVSRSSPAGESRTQMSLRDVARLYFDHARTINWIVGGFTLAALLAALVMPPAYRSSSELVVMNKRIGAPDGTGTSAVEADRYVPPSAQDIETEIQIIRSRRVMQKAAQGLIDDGVIPGPDGRAWGSLPEKLRAEALEDLVEGFVESVEVAASPGSTIVELSLMWAEPKAGATVLNRIVDTYLQERLELSRHAGVVPVLEKNRDFYKRKIVDLQAERAKLLATKGIARVEGQRELSAASLMTEQQSIRTIETRIAQIDLWVKQLTEVVAKWKAAGPGDAVFSPLPLQDAALQEAEQRVNEALSTYQSTITTYNRESQPARNAYATYAGLRRNYIALVESRIPQLHIERSALQSELRERRSHLAGLEGENSDVESIAAQIETLEIELTAAEEAYKSFSARRDAALANEVVARLQLSNVQVLEAATPALKPSEPNLPVMVAMGLFSGLLFALLYVAVRRLLISTFRSPEDVARDLRVPVLGYTVE